MSDLRNVPGIGAKKEKELMELGYDSLEALKTADPEDLYIKACLHQGADHHDHCQQFFHIVVSFMPIVGVRNSERGTRRPRILR